MDVCPAQYWLFLYKNTFRLDRLNNGILLIQVQSKLNILRHINNEIALLGSWNRNTRESEVITYNDKVTILWYKI